MEPDPASEREFARIPVELAARIRLLESDGEAQVLARELQERPSVWSVQEETELQRLATSSASAPEAVLARALLEVAAQLQRLRYRVLRPGPPMEPARVTEISGSGLRLSTERLLQPGTRLEIQLEDDENGAPPLRLLGEVVHASGRAPAFYGVRFVAAHPADARRLLRFIYEIQRRALRGAGRRGPQQAPSG